MRVLIVLLVFVCFGCKETPPPEPTPEKPEEVPQKSVVEFVEGAPLETEMPISAKFRSVIARTSVLNQETLPDAWTSSLPVALTETAFDEAGLDWSKPIAVVPKFGAHVAVIADLETLRIRFNLQDETKRKFGFSKTPWDWTEVTTKTPFHKLYVHPDKPTHDGWTFYRNNRLGLSISIFEEQYVVFAALDTHHDLFDIGVQTHNADIVVRGGERTLVATIVDETTMHLHASVPAEPFYVATQFLTESGRPSFMLRSVGLMFADEKIREEHKTVSKELDTLLTESKQNVKEEVTKTFSEGVQPDPGFADNQDASKILFRFESLSSLLANVYDATQKERHVEARQALRNQLAAIDKRAMKASPFGSAGLGSGDLKNIFGKGLSPGFKTGIGGPMGEGLGRKGFGGLGTGGGSVKGIGGLGTKGTGQGKSGYGAGLKKQKSTNNAQVGDLEGATNGRTDDKK